MGKRGFYTTIYGTTNFFCGILNHPNMLGIFNLFSIAYIIYIYVNNNDLHYDKIIFFIENIILITTILSKAITSIFGVIVMYIIYMVKCIKKRKKNLIYFFVVLPIIFTVCVSNYEIIVTNTKNIIFKYNSSSLLSSREEQFDRVFKSFKENPIIGQGFGVDKYSEKSYSSNNSIFTAPIEKGNIILAILSESGISGFILFVLWNIIYINEYYNKKNKYLIYCIISFLISNIGEMTYFSVNSIAILNCTILGIYYINYLKEVSDKNKLNI